MNPSMRFTALICEFNKVNVYVSPIRASIGLVPTKEHTRYLIEKKHFPDNIQVGDEVEVSYVNRNDRWNWEVSRVLSNNKEITELQIDIDLKEGLLHILKNSLKRQLQIRHGELQAKAESEAKLFV